MNRPVKTIILGSVAFLLLAVAVPSAIAQNIPAEATRHMNRGQAAVEMAKNDGDLEDAIKEFRAAAQLAPDWAAPYYNLGIIQNKTGHLNDAAKNLTRYLRLAPGAADAGRVQQLIDKIGYRIDKESEFRKAFDLLGTDRLSQKIVSRKTKGPGNEWATSSNLFHSRNGVLGATNFLYQTAPPDGGDSRIYKGLGAGSDDWKEWVPVTIDGRSFEYSFTYIVPGIKMGPGINGAVSGFFVAHVKARGEIISLDPIRVRTLFTEKVPRFISDRKVLYDDETIYTTETIEEYHEKKP